MFCLALSPIFILILKEAARAERQTAYSSRKIKLTYVDAFFAYVFCQISKKLVYAGTLLGWKPEERRLGNFGAKKTNKSRFAH